MTATNHALTGALIAVVVKKPELAIPLAFLSHFMLDLIPHYNPPGVTRDSVANNLAGWSEKMKSRTFRFIFAADMFLFLAALVMVPLVAPAGVSAWTVFLSALAAASPDFFGGFKYLVNLMFGAGSQAKTEGRLANFHLGLQWMERPWGIYVESAWAVLIISLLWLRVR